MTFLFKIGIFMMRSETFQTTLVGWVLTRYNVTIKLFALNKFVNAIKLLALKHYHDYDFVDFVGPVGDF